MSQLSRFYTVMHREGDPENVFWLARTIGRFHCFTWNEAAGEFSCDPRATTGGKQLHAETREFVGPQIAAFERVMVDNHLNDCRAGVDWLEPRKVSTPPPGPRKPVPEGYIDLVQAVDLMAEHDNPKRRYNWESAIPYVNVLKKFAMDGNINWARYDGSKHPGHFMSFYVKREHVLAYCFRSRLAKKGEHKTDILRRADFLCPTSGEPIVVAGDEHRCAICNEVVKLREASPGRMPFHLKKEAASAA